MYNVLQQAKESEESDGKEIKKKPLHVMGKRECLKEIEIERINVCVFCGSNDQNKMFKYFFKFY